MDHFHTPHFGFSGMKLQDLGSSRWTLVSIACDASGSVHSYAPAISQALTALVEACRRSPESDHLLLRLLAFSSSLREVFGYRSPHDGSHQDYDPWPVSGCTALVDAAVSAVESCASYGAELDRQGFEVNGLVVVITDGQDNSSALKREALRKALDEARASSGLESVRAILVGVQQPGADLDHYLQGLHDAAGFDAVLPLDQSDAGAFSALAQFITRSVQMQSRALGSGQAASLPVWSTRRRVGAS